MFKEYFKRPFLTILLTFISSLIFSQNIEIKNIIVDSITFLNNRRLLNSLPTEAFKKKTFSNDSILIPYRILFPKNNYKKQKFPLIITFHNSTRIGNDNENQLEHLAKIWLRKDIYAKYNCYVVAPQFSKRSSIYEKNNAQVLVSTPSKEVYAILDLIKQLQIEFPNIDSKRVYLVGYSMGGSTVQNLLSLQPNYFAAIVSIAGVPDFTNLKNINNKGIWLIHGQNDIDNPYNGSLELSNKLYSNKKLRFTTFTNLNHGNIVIPFLVTEEIPKWLFRQKK